MFFVDERHKIPCLVGVHLKDIVSDGMFVEFILIDENGEEQREKRYTSFIYSTTRCNDVDLEVRFVHFW